MKKLIFVFALLSSLTAFADSPSSAPGPCGKIADDKACELRGDLDSGFCETWTDKVEGDLSQSEISSSDEVGAVLRNYAVPCRPRA